MIDPDQPLDVQLAKQDKIIKALMWRANQRHELGHSAYSLFQSAITLQSKVSEKTRDLEAALSTLGQTSTELETSEEARNQTQQSLTDALESIDGGLALFADGKLQVYNDFFKRLVPDLRMVVRPGLRLEQYFDAVTHSADVTLASDVAPLTAQVMQSGGDAAPYVFALKDDRWFVINYRQTSRKNTVVLQTEITAIVRSARLEKDRLIDEQEHFLKAAFDNMPQGVCTFSSDGTLLITNLQFATLLMLPIQLTRVGTSYGQIVEYLNSKILVGSMPHNSFDGLMRYLRRSNRLHLRRRHASRAVLDVDISLLPDGGCIVNVVDVTVQSQTTEELENRVRARTQQLTNVNTELRRQFAALTQAEEELRLAKAEVENAMTSKTRFFAAASHDLLQPINAAKLLISSLGDMALDARTTDIVQRLHRSFQSTETLLHDLLDIARLESVDMKLQVTAFDIGDMLQKVVEDIVPLAAEKGLRLDVVPSHAWVRSDRRYLARSVQNLVNNAIQYTEKGRVLVGCRRRGNQLVLEVWDTGVGISKLDQLRIFNEFTRVQSNSYGMGLGLSIVQRACAHLDHAVAVRSKPGVGSVFSITLPMVPPGVDPDSDQNAPTAGPYQEMDLIILLIENDPDVLFAMTQKLEGWGASVLACRATSEALQLVAELDMSPDIILADYQLDGADTGVEAILALRHQTDADLPAIMISGHQETDLKSLSKQHDFSLMQKPVKLSRLRPLIDWKVRRRALVQGGVYDQSLP
ncbi:PAS-domain containing protein [Loktanella agnita]|uniref:hybrid sensor histidine kinase/response regulator n=1 Tax=Loktanella agnita TaxID=287097 RepID=UPI003985A1EF